MVRCSLCGFLIIKPQRTTPCGVVWCGALLLAVRCGYAILQVILIRFLRFVRFDEHPYLLESLGTEIYHIGERN